MNDLQPAAGPPDDIPTYGAFIGGRWTIPDATIDVTSPAQPTRIVARIADLGTADVREAFAAARDAGDAWRATSPLARAEVLFRAADLLAQRTDAIGRELTIENGKTLAEGIGEARRVVAILRYHAGVCSGATGEVYASEDPDTALYTVREPVGVVGVITPWNFPIAIPAWKIAPALAYGNTVVWKPSELTPICAIRLTEALEEAGLPAGVLNLVTGAPQVIGEALTDDPDLEALTFTGSTGVGQAIKAKLASRNVKVQLELGGKNPIVVLPDANLERAVRATVRGAMMSAGQKCSATSRAFVHPAVAERFVERVVAATRDLRVGDPLDPATDVGPVVSAAQQDKVSSYHRLADEQGLAAAVGGEPVTDLDGHYVRPTVYVDVDPASPIAREEIFGPVLAIMTADDLSDALRQANDTPFGLSASIFTHDLGAAMRFARDVRVGVVHVNGETSGAEPHVPFGGAKLSSSHSREQGTAAREFFTDTKTIYVTHP